MTGVVDNPIFPHLGASPDGLIPCDCCGKGLLEIKCPYSVRHQAPEAVTKRDFFVERIGGDMKLKRTHSYYYQVQGQLAICMRDFCNFICWTPVGMVVERIETDPIFFENMKLKLYKFFVNTILPCILTGKSYHKENIQPTDGTFCY